MDRPIVFLEDVRTEKGDDEWSVELWRGVNIQNDDQRDDQRDLTLKIFWGFCMERNVT